MTAVAPAGQEQRTRLSLRGSVTTVTEFFGFAVNSILYQRGIYPAESFAPVNKYGMPVLVTTDDPLKAYLGGVLSQMANWLGSGQVKTLVLVVNGQSSRSVIERWTFDIDARAPDLASATKLPSKSDESTRGEIQAIMRQITASVTFLPVINEPCAFDLLVYTAADCAVPDTWELSDPQLVTNATDVKLRTFSTTFHAVQSAVSYADAGDQ